MVVWQALAVVMLLLGTVVLVLAALLFLRTVPMQAAYLWLAIAVVNIIVARRLVESLE